ncbi:hypothetical protein LXL04_006747 [Taraxacum kok-saghyz]
METMEDGDDGRMEQEDVVFRPLSSVVGVTPSQRRVVGGGVRGDDGVVVVGHVEVLNVHRCLVVFLLGTPDSTTNPNQRCHLLPSPPSRPEPHPTTAAIPIPGLSCSCGTTDLHLPPFSIAAGVGSSTIADAVGEENRRPSPPNLHHPLVYSSGDQGAANQFHRHLPPSLSVSLSLPDSCCQRRKAAFTIELEASPSLKNTSTTVASPTRLHLSNRTADLLFFPSSEIGPGRGVDRVPSLVPDSNRFHAC